MQEESRNDHDREEDVERKGNRIVGIIECNGDGAPDGSFRLRGLVINKHDSRRCVDSVSQDAVFTWTKSRTPRCKVHDAWESDDPVILSINNKATIELVGQPGSDSWMTILSKSLPKGRQQASC